MTIASAPPGGYLTIEPHNEARAWVGSTARDLTMTFTCAETATVPKTGKVNLIGSDCEMSNAS
ncbi:hypothetical protein C8250_042170 [Streptomyces sp. So13.3]|uniref:hypothetical protein n=1 Tax=Streptomyces TaxID=1883 RepID=UPI001106254F|nr:MULTISPECIES: hypothetical protein [Streptomyces]MCZ4102082.1 hypothetical protein [Streptomyces sp. H39-C1]QNA77524.1 hypothetical protein C8250_042170 [Streptomyces sp. So13.3]